MVELHNTETRFEAWVSATNSILDNGDQQRNVILHIESPDVEHPATPYAFEKLNDLYDQAEMEPIHTVAEWIFPGYLYVREGLSGVYENYPEQIDIFLKDTPNRWGTYALRMVRRTDPETGEEFNPLDRVIEKLRWANNPENPTYHSCYEIGIQNCTSDIPIYDPSKDRNPYYGTPCLSHISFKLENNEVHINAFYRSHDYRFKVPGNLLGLAQLQYCVANEIDAEMGDLNVHSSWAYVDDKRGKPAFRELVSELHERTN